MELKRKPEGTPHPPLPRLVRSALRRYQYQATLKDVRAHCYCASLLRTLFIKNAGATSFSSARTESKTQQNIELMTSALTWCANIFVGYSVNPTFFSGRSLPFLILSIMLKNKTKICTWKVLIISHILFRKGWIGTWIEVYHIELFLSAHEQLRDRKSPTSAPSQ